MSVVRNVTKETCRTCLSYFNEENEKLPLLNCLATADSCNRLELMKSVMTSCSLTLFATSLDQGTSEIFICMTCVIEINQMLNFLEKCIRSEEIFKKTAEMKEDNRSNSSWCSGALELQTQFDIKVKSKNEQLNQKSGNLRAPYALNKNNQNKDTKYKCHNCSETFLSDLSLAFHKYKHSGYKPHVCMICHENFKTLPLIKEHMEVAHDKTRYQAYLCRKCPKAFTTEQYLTRHKRRIHSAKRYSCGACKRTFSTVSSLKFHENVHLDIRSYSCTSCSKSFTSASSWRNHKSTAHADMKEFKCHCGSTFNRKKKLEVHVASVHENKDKLRKYQCPECEKKFHHPYSLRNHLNTHLGIKPFLCNACGAAFTALSNLTSHFRRIHSGDKRPVIKKYLCHACGDSFARASHLQRHTLRKHVPNVEKKHECPVCQKKFLEKSDLTGHVKLHDDVKPFVCDQCSKCFRTGWRLRAHVKRVHLGLRPFECPTCSVKFKTKSHLEKHIRTHTGEKPFPCPHCTYTCAEKSNLKKHINVHLKMT